MKKIKKDELYKNLGGFLSEKGVEFKEGPYTSRIRKSCGLLTDCINYANSGLDQAKTKIDEKLEKMRQVIHEKTAPRTPANPAPAAPKTKPKAKSAAKPEKKKTTKSGPSAPAQD